MKVLKDFSVERVSGGRSKLPWNDLLDGNIRRIEVEELQGVKPDTFKMQARTHAKKRLVNLDLRTVKEDGKLVAFEMKASPMTEEQKTEQQKKNETKKQREAKKRQEKKIDTKPVDKSDNKKPPKK